LPRKYKILFLFSWYPNRTNPTLGNFIQKHVETIAETNEVYALHVCADDKLTNHFFNIEVRKINKVETVYVYYKKIKRTIPVFCWLLRLFLYLEGYRRGLNYIFKKQGKPDIVHLHIAYPAGAIALYLKYVCGLRYVVSEHWSGYLSVNRIKLNFLRKVISRKIFNGADRIIVVTKNLETAIERLNVKTPFTIIPNVVDISIFSIDHSRTKRSKKQMLHISTLEEQSKNISGLLESICKLSVSRQDFELQIISDGNLHPAINLAKKLNIFDKSVFFDGTKTTEEIAAIMQHSDFFILFSNYESLPCVLIESLASGIPVIATKVGGIPEHITNDLGLLVEPGNKEQLLNAMNQMLDNFQKFDKNMLRDYAIRNFSKEIVGEKFQEVYQYILTDYST